MSFALTSIGLAVIALGAAAPSLAQSMAVTSAAHDGFPVPAGGSDWVVISRDGSVVAFASFASYVVPGDTNNTGDVFAHDRVTGVTEAVSLSHTGAFGNSNSLEPSISADGRFVAFASNASNLTANEAFGYPDIYVRDRQMATTERVTVSLNGSNPYGVSWGPSISDDGRCVAYMSASGDIVPGDTNGHYDIFVYDRVLHTSERVSESTAGAQANDDSHFLATLHAFSGDGRFVVFWSSASNLVANDTNSSMDIFLRDRQAGTTEAVSLDFGGGLANGSSFRPSISADGRFVSFTSSATDIVPNHSGFTNDVYLRDLLLGVNEIVDVDSSGVLGDAGGETSNLSADGRFVLFHSASTNLVGDDTNGEHDVFLRDRTAGTTERVSVGTDGAQSTEQSYFSDLSGDGRFVVFGSNTLNLVQNTLLYPTIYLRDRQVLAPVTTYCTAKVSSAGCVPAISSTGLCYATGYDDFHVVAGSIMSDKFGLFFWSSAPASIPFLGGFLCVQPPLVRTPVQSSGNTTGGSCGGDYAFHFSQAYRASHGILPGATFYVQEWNRDPGYAPPNNADLSDGLAVTVVP